MQCGFAHAKLSRLQAVDSCSSSDQMLSCVPPIPANKQARFLKSKARMPGRVHYYMPACPGSAVLGTSGERGSGPPRRRHWILHVVGGARSAHDERLVARFPPVVWPFHPSIYNRSAEQSLRLAVLGAGPATFGGRWAATCLRICSFIHSSGMMASRGLWPCPHLPRPRPVKSILAGNAHEKSSPAIWPYENGFLGKF
jgi:hypothetical protein